MKTASDLAAAFTARTATIGIIGLGYVGLPLAKAAIDKGFKVFGFDIDAEKVRLLTAGQSYIKQIPDATIAHMMAGGFRPTTDFTCMREADCLLICVPTPLTKYREPDLSYVVKTTEAILPNLRAGHLVALESTTYPGTTREVMKPILESGGLKSGRDFYLAYSPEREDPGNASFHTANTPKIVGGDGAEALLVAQALYNQLVPQTVGVSSLEAAEATKLTENIFRAVNIALVNELKVVFEAMGIDIWEVIDAAKTKPFGFMPFYPGPGLGGHCIPIDPFYLTWKAREYEISTRFVELAGEINTAMPRRVVEKLAQALGERFRQSLHGSRILIMGVAYKKNVDDTRESPAFKVMELLEERGATVAYHDPYVPVIGMTREHAHFAGWESVDFQSLISSSRGLTTGPRAARLGPVVKPRGDGEGYDAAMIITDHDGVDYAALVEALPLVVDTRNACVRAGIVEAGTVVKA